MQVCLMQTWHYPTFPGSVEHSYWFRRYACEHFCFKLMDLLDNADVKKLTGLLSTHSLVPVWSSREVSIFVLAMVTLVVNT